MRHPLQIVVSVVHIYSDILYFVTSSYAHYSLGIAYSRPEAIYFWVYYVFLNMLWIVIPGCESLLLREGGMYLTRLFSSFAAEFPHPWYNGRNFTVDEKGSDEANDQVK